MTPWPEPLFWTLAGIVLYTYGGYTVILVLLSLLVRRPLRRDEGHEPRVTFLITAYNEERDIARKIENTLSLDYPSGKLEILVASDGSTDRTDEIVREIASRRGNVHLLRVEGRVGKTETQNRAVRRAAGEIIIFSDSTTEYRPDAIRKIVRNYADPRVGAVSGRYNYRTVRGSPVGIGQVLFWNFENFIKSRQTLIRTITGCCGCIYSVRKAAYEPLPPDIISDLVQPLEILKKGYRIVFEPEAVAEEETTEKPSDEFRMRVRVITRGMNGILHARSLLNPFRYPFVAFQLISHKVLRWLVPVFVLGLFVTNLFLLDRPFYLALFAGQSAFFVLAAAGWVADTLGKRLRLFSVPLYFCVVNLASLVSLLNLLRGEKKVIWDTARN